DRTSPQPSTATAYASSDRRASGASDSLARCSLSVPFSNFASNLLVSHQYWTSPQPTSSCPGLPRYASSLLFQAGDGIVRRSPGGAPVPGNEREAGSPADRAAPRPRSLRLPTPCSEVKILKMDGDGAPMAGETPPPPPGLVAQSGAGHGARTAARHAVLLAVQEAAVASVAWGRAPGGALRGDVPVQGRATSAMMVTRAHSRANARD
ncbi:hypothetical protein THAOC_29377, partial [Thalassiosira oceanica]